MFLLLWWTSWPKSTLSRKDSFGTWQFITEGVMAGNEGRYIKTETETETTGCILVRSPWLVQPASLHNPAPTAKGWQPPQWAEYFHFNHWSRKCPTDMSVHFLNWEFPSPGNLIQLTKANYTVLEWFKADTKARLLLWKVWMWLNP